MKTKKPVRYIKGYSFLFEDEGNEIEAWFSSFSGLEKIFVNRELVSKKRTYSKNTITTFKVGENEYSLAVQVKSITKGPFFCTLNKNGKACKRQKLVFIKMRDLLNLKFIVLAISLVIVLASLHNFAGVPDLAIIVLMLVGFIFLFSKRVLPLAWIEDDEIAFQSAPGRTSKPLTDSLTPPDLNVNKQSMDNHPVMEIEINYDQQDWAEFQSFLMRDISKTNRAWLDQFWVNVFIWIGIGYITSRILIQYDGIHWPTFFAILGWWAIGYILSKVSAFNKSKAFAPSSDGVFCGHHKFTFSEQGISSAGNGYHSLHSWPAFKRVARSNGLIMVFIDTTNALIFPELKVENPDVLYEYLAEKIEPPEKQTA